jgi:hypothetical protein
MKDLIIRAFKDAQRWSNLNYDLRFLQYHRQK